MTLTEQTRKIDDLIQIEISLLITIQNSQSILVECEELNLTDSEKEFIKKQRKNKTEYLRYLKEIQGNLPLY